MTPEGREEVRGTVFAPLISEKDLAHGYPKKTHCVNDTREEIQNLLDKQDSSDAKLMQMSEVFTNLGVEPEQIDFEAEDAMYELSD